MDKRQSIGQRWAAYRPTKAALVWACLGSVVATITVGFAWGGWVTGGSAQAAAATAANEARAEIAAAFCVDKFRAANDADAQLELLRGTQNWNRRAFIEKGGWTAMPGSDLPKGTGAALCAENLLADAPAAGQASVTQ